jgi:hypothetical protein
MSAPISTKLKRARLHTFFDDVVSATGTIDGSSVGTPHGNNFIAMSFHPRDGKKTAASTSLRFDHPPAHPPSISTARQSENDLRDRIRMHQCGIKQENHILTA